MDIIDNDRYLIYDDGRVWSKVSNKFLTPYFCYPCPYRRIMFSKKNISIHRLVALHYVPNPDKERYTVVDHLDRNPLNNHYTNLRWVSQSINCRNTAVYANNKLGIKNISFNKKQNRYYFVKQIDSKKFVKRFMTLEEAVQFKQEYMNTHETADNPADVCLTSAPEEP